MAEKKVTGPASYFPSIEKKYGKPIEHWMKELKKVSKLAHMEQVAHLKEKFEEMGNAYFSWATSEPNLYRLMFGGYCEIIMEEHDSKAWNLLRAALDELLAQGVITKSARNGGEVIVWSAVHGASSLAIEGLMSPSDFPMVLKSIQRSLGIVL